MVYSELLFQLNKSGTNKTFAGIPMIFCGDLYQLPSVRGKPIYMSNQSVKSYITLISGKCFSLQNTRFHSLVSSRERLLHCLCASRFGRKSILNEPKYTRESCLDHFE